MRKLVFILVSILFISCASRKVQVDNTEIKTDSIVEKKDTIAMKTVDSIYIKNDITPKNVNKNFYIIFCKFLYYREKVKYTSNLCNNDANFFKIFFCI